MFGWVYWLINFSWRYFFSLIFTVPWIALIILAGVWYALNYIIQLFMTVFSWYNGIYWGLFWWIINELNPFWNFFYGIFYYIWYIWINIIFNGLDDICDSLWDGLDQWATDLLDNYFIVPEFQPSIFELPFAAPLVFIEIFLS